MYDRILVPVAGPSAEGSALERAVALARRDDATIELFHVVRTEPVATVSMEGAWPGVVTMAREEGESIVANVAASIEADVPVETAITEGSPSREIVARAREREIDLIVMATSGRVGLNRLLLGSVTERVVRQASVPVLTVRRAAGGPGDEASSDANVPT